MAFSHEVYAPCRLSSAMLSTVPTSPQRVKISSHDLEAECKSGQDGGRSDQKLNEMFHLKNPFTAACLK